MLISLMDTQEESQTYGVIRFSSKSKNILYSRNIVQRKVMISYCHDKL